ncbi:hypothetical protein U5903_21885 [Cereibacter johrii]|uniref:hypothetical protein n=1 Tax=Cereibacter johrii TaxID=445629 RepID=UPI002B258B95|nr:hypothetical protein [Cereibacter johrii]MEA5163436.1 hypothetical protein [Cereibacter johrii]
MAQVRHPMTGLTINEIEVRYGPISDLERETAKHLLAEGHPRWVVAAMIGRFPLTFNGAGTAPKGRRQKFGGNLSTREARRDPRQASMDDLFADLFGAEEVHEDQS